jgi:LmbE family N-acetylglucosaminyl deacetylase
MSALDAANTDIIRLGFPDGGVARHEAELAHSISACVPKGATLVAPFEFDGHPDHDAAGRAAIEASRLTGATLARYPIWAWHRGSPELWTEKRITRFVMGPRARQAKQRAVAQFNSQIADRAGGPILPGHVLDYFDRPYEVFLL